MKKQLFRRRYMISSSNYNLLAYLGSYYNIPYGAVFNLILSELNDDYLSDICKIKLPECDKVLLNINLNKNQTDKINDICSSHTPITIDKIISHYMTTNNITIPENYKKERVYKIQMNVPLHSISAIRKKAKDLCIQEQDYIRYFISNLKK